MVRNQIYSEIATYLETKGTVYCTSEYELVPKSLPCIFIIEADRRTPPNAVNLANDEGVHELTFEIQVFTNTGYEDAWTWMGHAETKLALMGFIEDTCYPMENIEQQYQRLVARFHKIITD